MLRLIENHITDGILLCIGENHGVWELAGGEFHLHTSSIAAGKSMPVAASLAPFTQIRNIVISSYACQHRSRERGVCAGKGDSMERGIHQNRHPCLNHHIPGDPDVIRSHVHGQDMAVAVEDAVVQLVLVMILQIGDRVCHGIDGMLQRVIGRDEMALRVPQRDDGLAVVEAVAHHGVDDDRVGKLRLLGRRQCADEQGGGQAGEAVQGSGK